jgi:hypothetical protein
VSKNEHGEQRRRHRDLYANSGIPGTFDNSGAEKETWRELVSLGLTFGLGLAGLAALVLLLA